MEKKKDTEVKNYQSEFKYPNSLEDALVVVSNIIARASTKWTLEETKMFLCSVSQIKKRDAENWVTLSKRDLAEKLRIDASNKPKMREMFRKTVSKSFIDFDGETEDDWMSGVLLTGIKSTKKDISVQFNPTYLPLLDQLSSHFTEFYLNSVLDFKHISSYKLYIYLVSWSNGIVGKNEKELLPKGNLYKVFGLKETDYWRDFGKKNAKFDWSNFEKFVLNPAIEEINRIEACDMNILKCHKAKTGKNVLGYEIEYVMTAARNVPPTQTPTEDNSATVAFDEHPIEPMFICENLSEEDAEYIPTVDELNALDISRELEKSKKKKRKKQHTLTINEYIAEKQPFKTDEQKELFDYIVDRYEYDIQSIKITSVKARVIQKLMNFSYKIAEYTDNTELKVLLLDYFEQKLDKNSKFESLEEDFDNLDIFAGIDDQLKIDIVKQSLGNGYFKLYPLVKDKGSAAERLADLPF